MPTTPPTLLSTPRTLYPSTQYLILTTLIIIGTMTLLVILCYHAYVCWSICVSSITGRESAVVEAERKLRWRSLVWKGGPRGQDVEGGARAQAQAREEDEEDERQGLVVTMEVEPEKEGGMRFVVVEETSYGTIEL